MKCAFISQPMRLKSEEQIIDERITLIGNLERLGYYVIPLGTRIREMKKGDVYGLGCSIELLSQADIVFFMPGWQYARGCIIEHDICKKYEIPYYEISKDEFILRNLEEETDDD